MSAVKIEKKPEFKDEMFACVYPYVTFLERWQKEGYIKEFEWDAEDCIIKHIVFSAKAFQIKFEDKPLNIVFHEWFEIFGGLADYLEEIKKRTYIWHDVLIEYGYAEIIPFKHPAILVFDLDKKRLDVYLLNWTESELEEAKKMGRISKKQEKFLKRLLRNFEYLQNFGNLTVISDDMPFVFTFDRWEQFWQILLREVKKRVWFMNEEDYKYVAAFVCLSYFQEILDTAPYMFFGGEKGSGKTRSLEVIADMGWRTSEAGSISVAVLARELDWHKSVMVLDEMSKGKDGKESVDERELNAILRAGIRRGGRYKRMKNQEEIGSYDVFGIKALATNRELPDDVLDRCLIITMFKNIKFKPSPRQKYEYINAFLSEFRVLFLLNNMIEKMQKKLAELRASMIEAGIEPRFAEILAPLIFMMPKSIVPRDLAEKLQVRMEQEKATETYSVYLALKGVISSRLRLVLAEKGILEFNEAQGIEDPIEYVREDPEVLKKLLEVMDREDRDVRFMDIYEKYLEVEGIWGEGLRPNEKRSIQIRIGLIIRNKFGFKTYRLSKRVEDSVRKETMVEIDFLKFLSFYDRFEEELKISEFETVCFYDVFKKFVEVSCGA